MYGDTKQISGCYMAIRTNLELGAQRDNAPHLEVMEVF